MKKEKVLLGLLILLLVISPVLSAEFRTPNFIVTAETPELAKEYALAAEIYRKELAIEYFGKEIPRWGDRCPIDVRTGARLGAGGATTFIFDHGEVFGWKMTIQGSKDSILGSVIPHEVMHMITATHLRQPIPRWLDEGISTYMESDIEKRRHKIMLEEFLKSKPSRGIPFDLMFQMKKYPADIMPVYAQGYSLTEFLIQQKGEKAFIQFIKDGVNLGNNPQAWIDSLSKNYNFKNLGELQNVWNRWVAFGSPKMCQSV